MSSLVAARTLLTKFSRGRELPKTLAFLTNQISHRVKVNMVFQVNFGLLIQVFTERLMQSQYSHLEVKGLYWVKVERLSQRCFVIINSLKFNLPLSENQNKEGNEPPHISSSRREIPWWGQPYDHISTKIFPIQERFQFSKSISIKFQCDIHGNSCLQEGNTHF